MPRRSSTKNKKASFEQLATGPRTSFLAEFWQFLKYNKKWWLLPIIVVLLLLGLIIMLGGTAVAPFLYPLF